MEGTVVSDNIRRLRELIDQGPPEPVVLVPGFFESAPDAMLLVAADGVIVAVNRFFEIMFGYQRERIVGARVEVLVPVSLQDGHVDRRAEFDAAPSHRRMANGGRTRFPAVRANGNVMDVDIMLSPVALGDQPFTMAVVREVPVEPAASQ